MNDEFSAVDVSKADETTSEPVVNTNVGGGSGGYRIRRLRCCTRDGGWLALRSLPAGGGFKAPCAAAVTAVRGERHGKGALSARQLGTGKMVGNICRGRVERCKATSEPVVNTNVGGGSGGYRIRRLRCCTRDGGWLALRSLPAGGGFKAPCAAAVTAVRGERHGKGALSACQLG